MVETDDVCLCEKMFRTAEDYRDHLPCGVGKAKPTPPPPPYELVTMYQYGHSDGYTHSYTSALYRTSAAAKLAGEMAHGNYAVGPKSVCCIKLDNGIVYIVDGPWSTADEVEAKKLAVKHAMSKLTLEEIDLLGLNVK